MRKVQLNMIYPELISGTGDNVTLRAAIEDLQNSYFFNNIQPQLHPNSVSQ